MQLYGLLLLRFDAALVCLTRAMLSGRPVECGLCDSEMCCDHQKGSQFSFRAWKQLLYFLQLIMSVPRALEGGCIPSPSVDMPMSGRSCSKEGTERWFPSAITLQSPEPSVGSRDLQTEQDTLGSFPKGFAYAWQKQQHCVGLEYPPLSCPGGCEAQKDVARQRPFTAGL